MQESSLGRWPKLDSHCEKKAFIPGWEEGLTMGAGCPSQGCSIQHPCEEPAWGQYRSLNQEEGTKNSDILDGITGLRHWTSLEPTTPQASHQASWWISFQVKPVWSGFLLYAAKCFPLDVVSKRQEDSVWKTNDWGTRTHRNNNWQILNHSPGFLQTCHSKVHQCVLRAWLWVLGQGCGKGESDDPLALQELSSLSLFTHWFLHLEHCSPPLPPSIQLTPTQLSGLSSTVTSWDALFGTPTIGYDVLLIYS